MSCLHYQDNELYIENVSLKNIAEKFGTPCYVYSRAKLVSNWQDFNQAFEAIPHRICYAVKANSNIALLHLLAQLKSGFDIVSGGELERVLVAKGNPQQIIFSGVGKKTSEIEQAIKQHIYCFNVESEAELDRIQTIASNLNTTVSIALRINPNIDAHTHSYISTGLKENKFGIEMHKILPICRQLAQQSVLKLIGLACHIGSQITKLRPFLLSIDHLLNLYKELVNLKIPIQHINLGGGLGIIYHDENPPSLVEYANMIKKKFAPYPLEIILEPGRAIVGSAGILLTRIEYLKQTQQKNFAIVDAGMNDFLRPALYHAWQQILPVNLNNQAKKLYDIVGPVCESADFIGKDRELAIEPDDLLAIDTTGAYGFSMSSNYNSRVRPAEVLVDGSNMHLIRRRETIAELMHLEKLIDL